MRVLVATTAGSGHFGPLIPFAEACRGAGHDVLVAAPESFQPAVAATGFPFWPCADTDEADWQAVMASLPHLSFEEANVRVIRDVFGDLDTRATLPRMRAAMEEWRPDVVLRESCELGSYVAAELAGVPHVRVAVGLAAMEESSLPLLAEPVAGIRESVGLPADPDGHRIRAAPCFSLVPRSLEDPSLPDLDQTQRFFDARPGEPPSGPLPDWWPGVDGPIVYVSFGTVASTFPPFAAIHRIAIDALEGVPARLLVTTGHTLDTDDVGPVPPNVHVERWVAEDDVLTHASAVVSHGGFGTTLKALLHGLPLAVFPLFGDQPFNARGVAAAGAGLAVEGGPPNIAALADAVSTVLQDGSYRRVAQRIAEDARQLPTTDAAVESLEQIARR